MEAEKLPFKEAMEAQRQASPRRIIEWNFKLRNAETEAEWLNLAGKAHQDVPEHKKFADMVSGELTWEQYNNPED